MQSADATTVQGCVNLSSTEMFQSGRTTVTVEGPPQQHRRLTAGVRPVQENKLASRDPAVHDVPPQQVEYTWRGRQQLRPGILAVQAELARLQQLDANRRGCPSVQTL